MKVSYRWVRDVAPGLDLSVEEAAARLALRGAPVEAVEDLAAGLRDIVVGRVLSAEPHPNADRLTLCRVLGPAGEVPVVCGAPDVRAGSHYPFAPVGAALPGGFRIGKRKIRGAHSRGMLCSESELGLGPDDRGIMLLEGDHEPGTPFARAAGLDDHRLDVEVTPNRGDLLSHIGIARELHPDGHKAIALPAYPDTGDYGVGVESYSPGGAETRSFAVSLRVRIEDPDLCPRYMAAAIRSVRVGPSPRWLADRLRAAGARPVNNVVDATNYVMLEMGQPLHAFDLGRLAGTTIAIGRARAGETLVTLDGEERGLSPEMLTIRDADGPVAVAGVMGGKESEVTGATTDLLLECALFEPRRVRAARRGLGMSTDASYRFERGVDPVLTHMALLRAAELIFATAGGAQRFDMVDAHPGPWTPPVVSLRPSRAARVLGVEFSADRIAELLAPLGYAEKERREDAVDFAVPGHRSSDTLREVDLIEEVARAHGYDSFPAEMAPFRPGTVPDHPLFQLEDRLRSLLAADGASEAQTPALGPPDSGDVAVLNPMSAEESRLRRDRLPGLLRHVERNMARGVRDVRLFEIGTAFAPGGEGAAPVETARVAVALAGRRAPPHWSSGAEERFDVYDAARVLRLIGGEAWPGGEVAPGGGGGAGGDGGGGGAGGGGLFAPGASFVLRGPDGAVVGRAGEIAGAAVDLPAWGGTVIGVEVELPPEPRPREAATAAALPDQPSSERDVAFLLPPGTAAGDVLEAVRAAGGRLLEEAAIFDVYEGGDLPEGARSVAVRLRFRAPGRTLTEKEVAKACRRVTRKVVEATGVEPRS